MKTPYILAKIPPVVWMVLFCVGLGVGFYLLVMVPSERDWFTAVATHDYETVQRMANARPTLLRATDVNGRTALNLAEGQNDPQMVRILMQAGSDPYAHPDNSSAPLQEACRYGKREVVEELLRAGVDVNRQIIGPNYSGAPLHAAAEAGRLELVKLLVEHGADVNAENERDPAGTPLFEVFRIGRDDIMEYLFAHGARLPRKTPLNRPLLA